MALSDVPTARTFLSILPASFVTPDAWLQLAVPAACGLVQSYCKRQLETATYTDYLDGNGLQVLPTRQRPVLSITSVNMDPAGFYGQGVNAFSAGTLLNVGKDYVLKYGPDGNATSKSGLLVRLGGGISGTTLDAIWPWEWRKGTLTARLPPVWPPGLGNIKVVYSAGLGTDPAASGGTLPEDLTNAVNMIVLWMRRYATLITQSETLGAYSYSLAPLPPLSQLPDLGDARQILSRYRELAI